MGRLYNWQYAKQRGKEKRLEAEMNAHKNGVPVPSEPPLFSHDTTLQSCFNKAWKKVSPCEIRRHLGVANSKAATDLIAKIRRIQPCP